MAKKPQQSSKGLTLEPHPKVDPPITVTQGEIDAKHADIKSWLRDAGLDEEAYKNWAGSAEAFLTQAPDPENEQPSILEVARLHLAHGEGPSKHLHWWNVGGTLAESGEPPTPEPPPDSGYAAEPPRVSPDFSRPADLLTLYPADAKWRPLVTGEEDLGIARAAYLIRWDGSRGSLGEADQRFAKAKESSGRPFPMDERFWKFGWLTGPQGFSLEVGITEAYNQQYLKTYGAITPERYLSQQFDLASGGGTPSGG